MVPGDGRSRYPARVAEVEPSVRRAQSRADMTLAGRAAEHRAKLTARQEEVVQKFLARASVLGERAICWARRAVCGFALIRLLFLYQGRLLSGEPKVLLSFAGLLLGGALSVLAIRRLDPSRPRPIRFVLWVVLDWFIVTVVLAPIVLWPHPGYHGFLRELDHAIFYLTIICAGLRLNDRALAVGVSLNTVAMFAFIGLDMYLWPDRVTYPGSDVVLMAIYLFGTSAMAIGVSRYTRRLVRDGAAQTLAAEKARQRLGVYVSEVVARSIDERESELLGGNRTQIAVLFSDLRGFTSYSQRVDPEHLVAELNEYLGHMVEAIHEQGGLVDKYIGDAIMAVFGLDDRVENPALAAIRCAAAMQQELRLLNHSRRDEGLAPLVHGVGVHYGYAVAGNIGTFDRMQYTVVGDAVNTASRIEGATKEQGHQVLISRDAVERARTSSAPDQALPKLRDLGAIAIRGRVGTVEVYTLVE